MTTDRRRKIAAHPDTDTTPPSPLAFEEALSRVDAAVTALESGQIPLDDALAIYEEGVRMARRCHELLDAAQLRVQRLSASGDPAAGTFALDAFEPDSE
jgi:exodeoxyribonuclease VII small subunit